MGGLVRQTVQSLVGVPHTVPYGATVTHFPPFPKAKMIIIIIYSKKEETFFLEHFGVLDFPP